MKKAVNNLLNTTQLVELEEAIKEELDDSLLTVLSKLNRTGQLEELLSLLGMNHLLETDNGYQVYKTGKIIVVGQSDVKADVLLSVAGKLGIDKKRFELHLDYEDAVKMDFRRTQWDPTYSAILVGPMPHSGVSKGDFSSVIAAIENQEGFPPIRRLGSNSLKITKTDFKNKLKELVENGTISA